MARQHLPTITLRRLEADRDEAADMLIAKVVDHFLPEALAPLPVADMIVTWAELGLTVAGYGGTVGAVQGAIGKGLARVSEILTRPYHLKFESGAVRIVGDPPRRDMIETLVKLRAVLAEPNDSQVHLRLVAPAVGFTNACFNYRWRGTIFEFTAGFMPGLNHPRHVAWHPSPTYDPAPSIPKYLTDQIHIGRVQHRTHSDQSGQDSLSRPRR